MQFVRKCFPWFFKPKPIEVIQPTPIEECLSHIKYCLEHPIIKNRYRVVVNSRFKDVHYLLSHLYVLSNNITNTSSLKVLVSTPATTYKVLLDDFLQIAGNVIDANDVVLTLQRRIRDIENNIAISTDRHYVETMLESELKEVLRTIETIYGKD